MRSEPKTRFEVTPMPQDGHGGPTEPPPLADAVHEALAKTGHGCLRRVVVVAERGSIALRGRVPSYYLKQLAQVTVMAVPGVEAVRNELEVDGGR